MFAKRHRFVVFFFSLAGVTLMTAVAQAQLSPRQPAPTRPDSNRPTLGPARPQTPSTTPRVARQQPAPAGVNRQAAGPPPGFLLKPSEQKVIDEMLAFWERKTSSIRTLQAEFGRWVYDPVFGPKDPNIAKTFTTGEIRYAAPDKGMIRERALSPATGSGVYEYDKAMAAQGAKWPYKQKEVVGEHWVCDGKSVYEFNHDSKELVETVLPPDMQGKAIAEGPLPFMFGAKAATIKERYWIRQLKRDPQKNEPYHLEFVPKQRGAEFSRVRIKLDPEKFLPVEMVLYDLNLEQGGRSAYAFKNMQANGATNSVKNLFGGFVSPKTPLGWKKIVHDIGNSAPAGPPRQAQGPAKPVR